MGGGLPAATMLGDQAYNVARAGLRWKDRARLQTAQGLKVGCVLDEFESASGIAVSQGNPYQATVGHTAIVVSALQEAQPHSMRENHPSRRQHS